MNTYNEADLSTFKTADILGIYNAHASTIGATVISKFRDKKTAIARTLLIQEKAVEIENEKLAAELEAAAEEPVVEEPVVEEPVVEEPVAAPEPVVEAKNPAKKPVNKPAKLPAKKSTKGNSKTDMTANVEIAQARDTREGSIGYMMFAHITANQELGLTVQELVDFMVTNYTKPRSDVPITKGFVVDTIRYFIRNGNIKLS
jgi:hypothetical protein